MSLQIGYVLGVNAYVGKFYVDGQEGWEEQIARGIPLRVQVNDSDVLRQLRLRDGKHTLGYTDVPVPAGWTAVLRQNENLSMLCIGEDTEEVLEVVGRIIDTAGDILRAGPEGVKA